MIVVTNTSIRLPSKNVLNGRLLPGSQTMFATAISPTRRLIDTTSRVASLVPRSPRIITRSISNPIAGASTPSARTSATGVGIPQAKRNCQYEKATNMPIAPCAKLKMPVVAYVRTSPLATIA